MFEKLIEMLKDSKVLFKEDEIKEFFKDSKLPEDSQIAVMAIAKILKSSDKDIPDDFFTEFVKAIPEFGKLATVIELKAKPDKEALEKLVKDLTEKITIELEKEMDMGDKVIALMKKDLDTLKEQNVHLEKSMQIEKDSRMKSEITSMVKEEHLPGEVEDTVALLFDLKKTDEKLYDKSLTNMRNTAKTLKAAGLFKEDGSSGDDTETGKTASDKLMQIAKDLRKDDPKLSLAKSMRLAGRLNPDLYKEQTVKTGGNN